MKNVIIIIILLFTIKACKPIEQKEEIIQYPVDNEFKKYFGSFKEGSWWAYQDTVSGTIDTFRVTTYLEENKSDCSMIINEKKVYSSLIYYKVEHNLTSSSNIWTYRVRSDCDFPEESFVDINFGTGSGIKIFFVENQFLNYVSLANNDSLISTYHSTYSLNNVNYNDVYYVENTSEVHGYDDFDFIYCKNIGIIGFNGKNYFDNNYVAYWVLIDKNIIQ